MGAIQSPENLTIKSSRGEYRVDFPADLVESLSEDLAREHVLVIDRRVGELHGKRLGITGCIAFEAKEANKNLHAVPGLVEEILGAGVTKKTKIVVIGGGITQDMGAFAASMVFRGLPWIFYPTTLLAQADSCIGSKTSINVGGIKNQVGNFYPPERVVISPQFLETLSSDDIKSGMGEIIKVHLLAGEEAFQAVERIHGDRARITSLVRRSLEIKKPFVEADEFDTGVRNLLNYGHTFGHALESATNYLVPHGQAVTVGMDIANFISHRRGLLSEELFLRIRHLLKRNFPNVEVDAEFLSQFLVALKTDKKNERGKLVAILTRGPGRMFKENLDLDQLENDIKVYFQT